MALTDKQLTSFDELHSKHNLEIYSLVINKQAPSGILVIVFQHRQDLYYEGFIIYSDGRIERRNN